MNKAFSHKTRCLALAMASMLALVLAPWLGQAAGLNEPVAARSEALAQAASQSTLVWIGAFADGIVPMRPVEFVRQENGDLLVKGGAVVKAAPMAWWPVLRGGGQGHFFVFAPNNPRGVYWIMDPGGQRPGARRFR